MRTFIIYLTLALLTGYFPVLQAQEETWVTKIERLEKQKEEIISAEKDSLKIKVEAINQRLESKIITREQAVELKKEAAKKHALNIENKTAIIDNRIALLSREEDNFENREDGTSNIGFSFNSERKEKQVKYDQRTTSFIVVAVGFNNALQEGEEISDSDFSFGGSRFFEIGWAWKTRVFKNSNWLRLKYGASFQFNGFKPTDNRYFVQDGELTYLEEFPLELDKSKFRVDNLVFPLHFEFGPSKKSESNTKIRFYTYKKFKIGLGGYAGINLGERQKLKYKEDGEKIKRKIKNDFNTNDLIYGLSGYVGWGGTALYVRYDLNPIFEAPNLELRNASIGLKFDLD